MEVKSLPFHNALLGIFSRRRTGFHKHGGQNYLNWTSPWERLSSRWSNLASKIILTAGQFAWCPALNPLTPGTFCRKCVFWTFWWFLDWISAKLPLIQSKMHLQHNSLPFLPPALCFSALWDGHVQKSKFWDLGFLIFGIFSPFLFLLFSSFCCSDWPSTKLACSSKTSEKASSRQAIFSMEQPGVVVGNFALSFSLNFLSIFGYSADHSDLGIIGKIFSSCRSWV